MGEGIFIDWVNTQVDTWETDDLYQPERPDWWPQRKCANPNIDPKLFFPTRGDMSGGAAKRICHTCPVMLQCREYGMDEEFGVWGGWSGRQRDAERKRRNRETHKHVAPCGTEAGYQWHRTRNQFACNDCKLAHARHEAIDKQTRSARRWAKRAKGWCSHCADEHHARCNGNDCTCPKCGDNQEATA